jgi:hypothetical protein
MHFLIFYSAGFDTVSCIWLSSSMFMNSPFIQQVTSTVHTFFLCMTLYPDIQKRAQEEIDAVLGTGRLPTLADQKHLPYVEALVKEILRWGPAGPRGSRSLH